MTRSIPDPGAIEHALRAIDPSALVDVDPQGKALRVAASIDATGLASVLSQAGYPVTPDQIVPSASTCCGGCSG
jgi:hypothetical protein